MKKILFFTVFTLAITSANAQIEWENVKTPEGITGFSTCHAIDSLNFLLGAQDGVYRTSDGGNIWIYEEVSGYNFGCFAIESFNSILYHSNRNDLYKKNGLESEWRYKTSALGNIIDIYAPNDSTIFLAHWYGITRSIDSGNTWQLVFEGGSNEVFNSIVQHPNGMLFAGSINYEPYDTGGVSVSYDNGETWERKGMKYAFVEAVAVDSEGNIYAGCYWNGGISKSVDLGETWSELNSSYEVKSIVITPGDTIYIGCTGTLKGIYMSVDYGVTWENISNNIEYPNIDDLHLGKDGRIYGVIDNQTDSVVRTKNPVCVDLNEPINTGDDIITYPNPAKDILNIYVADSRFRYSAEIYNFSGTKILSLTNQRETSKIDVSYMQPGAYILKVVLNTKVIIKKIIKT